MKKLRYQVGFTLIETLLYMGLLGLFITIMGSVFQEILQTSLTSTFASALEQDGKYMLSRMGYDIRRANEIVTPAAGQTASAMTLTMMEDGQDIPYEYTVSEGRVMLARNEGAADRIQSNETTTPQASFTRIGNTIQITLVLSSVGQVPGAADVMQFQTTYSLR